MTSEGIKYTPSLDIWSYVKFTSQAFGVLILLFMIATTLQSTVVLTTGFSVMAGEPFLGCTFQQSGSPLATTCGYFLHNSSVALMAWVGGFVVVGPLWVLWENGINLGTYLSHALMNGAYWGDTIIALAFLIPHGIFEIPALILSISLGLFIANSMWDERGIDVDYDMWETFKMTVPWALVMFGLLAVAAFIEANISHDFALWIQEVLS